MEAIFLIGTENKFPTFLGLDVKEQVDGCQDLNKEAINKSKLFVPAHLEEDVSVINKCKCRVNFARLNRIGVGEYTVDIDSPTTKANLKNPKTYTIVVICENVVGDRIGFICADHKGELFNIDMKTAIAMATKVKGFFTNAFLKNGAIQFTQGNYVDKVLNKSGEVISVPIIPTVKVGQALQTEKKIENTKTEKIDLKNLLKYKDPVRAMIQHGFVDLVKENKLYNESIPEENLWFYFSLMRNGKGNIVSKMVTSQEFKIEQLNQIALGIMEGVNVKAYSDPAIDAATMQQMREDALKGIDSSAVPKRIKDIQVELNKTGWKDRKKAAQLDQVRIAIHKSKKV